MLPHWCQDETNAVLATFGMLGPAVIWVKVKFKTLRLYVASFFRRAPKPIPCKCGHAHETKNIVPVDSTGGVKVSD